MALLEARTEDSQVSGRCGYVAGLAHFSVGFSDICFDMMPLPLYINGPPYDHGTVEGVQSVARTDMRLHFLFWVVLSASTILAEQAKVVKVYKQPSVWTHDFQAETAGEHMHISAGQAHAHLSRPSTCPSKQTKHMSTKAGQENAHLSRPITCTIMLAAGAEDAVQVSTVLSRSAAQKKDCRTCMHEPIWGRGVAGTELGQGLRECSQLKGWGQQCAHLQQSDHRALV
eukprot:1160449-Pelagomonas_calceolata.AAC.5